MARTEGQWQKGISLITPSENVPILLRNEYLNFGGDLIGETGYGFRDNAGVMEFKDSGGSWGGFGTGGGLTSPVGIADGGTGVSAIAAKSIWVANSADTIVALTPGASQSIRMNSSNTAWEVYTPGASTGITWSEVTGTTQAAAVNSAYIVNNAALVTVTLPDNAAVGDIVRIVGKGAGLWTVAQNASENINFGNVTTTTGVGGSLSATLRYDCVELVCTVANTTWTVANASGNITYV